MNVIEAALDSGVKKVVALSTDKAVNPVNLYGGTKLVSDKLFVAANAYVGNKDISFSIVRYGNVAGSRGSIIPLFHSLIERGETELPITDLRMTPFLDQPGTGRGAGNQGAGRGQRRGNVHQQNPFL